MKKIRGRKEKERLIKAVTEEYDREEDESSDDEMPEMVSNAAMKSNQEVLNKELEHHKQQLRHAEKIKRRQKQEMFVAQKKAKGDRLELDMTGSADNLDEKSNIRLPESVPENAASKTKKAVNKVYSSLNITVEPLTNVQDSRASKALNFKSRRMAKVPRESIKTAVISYQKKLLTRK